MPAHYDFTRSQSPLFVSQASSRASTPIKMEHEANGFRHSQNAPRATPDLHMPMTPPITPPARQIPSQEQQSVIDLILTGLSVFVTGAAGSGKSFIIQEVARELRALSKCVRITAPTGLAASHIEGSTIHSFCSWAPSDEQKSIRQLEDKAKFGNAQGRFDETDVLIIDEISMVSNYTFERLNRVMKAGRNNDDSPFGGAQIVVFGDFCQLPPVKPFEFCFFCGNIMKSRKERGVYVFTCTSNLCNERQTMDKQWAFSSDAWIEANFANVHLTETHRQTELAFKRILKTLRIHGTLSQRDIDLLMRHESETDGATKLYPRRVDVESYNKQQLERLPGEKIKYKCLDYFRPSEKYPEYDGRGARHVDQTLEVLYDHPYQKWNELKVGMPVLLQTNLDVQGGLVNGSQGKIIGFEDHDEANLRRARFAVERIAPTSADDQELEGFEEQARYISYRGRENAVIRHEQVLQFIEKLPPANRRWPIVRFSNGRTMTIFADCRLDELGSEAPHVLEGRTQIPLVPMWAMTLHKAQGTTLDKAVVNLSGKFGAAQTYVALSRARTLRGLKVEHLGVCGSSEVDRTVESFLKNTRWDLGRLDR